MICVNSRPSKLCMSWNRVGVDNVDLVPDLILSFISIRGGRWTDSNVIGEFEREIEVARGAVDIPLYPHAVEA